MIPFKGRSDLKQYMPMKPIKRGIKVWAWADANNGYVSAFEVYTGRKGNTTEKGLGAAVIYKGTDREITWHIPSCVLQQLLFKCASYNGSS